MNAIFSLVFMIPLIFTAPFAAAAPEEDPATEAPRLEDFAGQMTLSASEGELMYLELPEDVYRHAERSDLGDIRLFDSGGTPVPFEIRRPPEVRYTPPPAGIPFFPWTPGDGKSPPGQADIEIDAAGAVIRLNAGSAALGQALKPDSFLVDLSELPFPPLSLALEMGEGGEQFNSPVTLRYSGDLADWRLFDKAQTIARYGTGPAGNRNTLVLPEAKAPYIMLTFGETVPPLRKVTASFKTITRPETVKESLFPGTKSEDGFSVFYAPGGYFPVIGIDFLLPQADSLKVEIKNRLGKDLPWETWARGNLYHFKADTSAASAEERSAVRKNKPWKGTSHAPYWLLRAEGGLPFASVPDMQLIWEPYQVVFLARGTGPWILAYGNRNYGPMPGSWLSPAQDQKLLPASVTGGERYTPRTPEAAAQRDYRQWILWGVLILAVLILSGLAWFMAKSMKENA
jgi:hypothetical protein